MQARLSCVGSPPTVVNSYFIRSHCGDEIVVQINVAAVDDAIARVHRMREVNTLNASISEAEILALHDGGEHLLFDGSHGVE